MSLPEGYSARPAGAEDAEAVLAVIAAVDLDELGEVDYELDDVRDDWTRPRLDLARDSLLVVDGDGAVAGYGLVWNREGGFDLEFDQYVHPAHQHRGVEEHVVEWAESRAGAIAVDQRPEQPPVLTTFLLPTSPQPHIELLLARGYVIERVFLRMGIDLASWGGVSADPVGVTIRGFDQERDARAVYEADGEGFAEHYRSLQVPFEEFAEHHFDAQGYDPTLWLVAVDDDSDEIAGTLFGYPHLRGGWVRSLSVRPGWRGRGVGLALLEGSFALFRGRGVEWVGLSVDAENATGATRLYERAGMHEETRIDTYRKGLPVS